MSSPDPGSFTEKIHSFNSYNSFFPHKRELCIFSLFSKYKLLSCIALLLHFPTEALTNNVTLGTSLSFSEVWCLRGVGGPPELIVGGAQTGEVPCGGSCPCWSCYRSLGDNADSVEWTGDRGLQGVLSLTGCEAVTVGEPCNHSQCKAVPQHWQPAGSQTTSVTDQSLEGLYLGHSLLILMIFGPPWVLLSGGHP